MLHQAMRGVAVLLIGLILGGGVYVCTAFAACKPGDAARPPQTTVASGLRLAEGRGCLERCMARCRASGNSTQYQICARQCVVSCGR